MAGDENELLGNSGHWSRGMPNGCVMLFGFPSPHKDHLGHGSVTLRVLFLTETALLSIVAEAHLRGTTLN